MDNQQVPLIVDLDGTLLRTDVFWELLWKLLANNPLQLLSGILQFLRGGVPAVKRFLVQRVWLDVETLTYNPDIIDLIDRQKRAGQTVYLATGADQIIVDQILQVRPEFSTGYGSDGTVNLVGANKLALLRKKFAQFDYVGNEFKDIQIFKASRTAYLVSASKRLIRAASAAVPNIQIISVEPLRFREVLKGIRIHQWLKNLLVFIPILMAHKVKEAPLLAQTVFVFFAMSLVASATYLLNDLMDLDSDRRHRVKKNRMLASGRISIPDALATAGVLFVGGFGLARVFVPSFMPFLAGYVILTWSYSRWFKSMVMLDVLLLSGLYTYRVVASAAALLIPLSSWLLAFSMFFFTGLAFLKRYIELLNHPPEEKVRGRSYQGKDRGLVQQFGVTSGFLSILVFPLYIELGEISLLYQNRQWLWLICPALLYWTGRIWFLAERNQVHSDPVEFAVTDKISLGMGILVLIFMYMAT